MTRYFKSICVAVFLFTGLASRGQTSDNLIQDFQRSIEKNLNYRLLTKDCNATFTVLKAEIDGNGKVKNIILSDSADPLFNMEFIFVVNKLDKEALEKLAVLRKLKSTTILMPIYFSVVTAKCPRPTLNADSLSKSFQFNNEDFRSNANILPTLKVNLLVEESDK